MIHYLQQAPGGRAYSPPSSPPPNWASQRNFSSVPDSRAPLDTTALGPHRPYNTTNTQTDCRWHTLPRCERQLSQPPQPHLRPPHQNSTHRPCFHENMTTPKIGYHNSRNQTQNQTSGPLYEKGPPSTPTLRRHTISASQTLQRPCHPCATTHQQNECVATRLDQGEVFRSRQGQWHSGSRVDASTPPRPDICSGFQARGAHAATMMRRERELDAHLQGFRGRHVKLLPRVI